MRRPLLAIATVMLLLPAPAFAGTVSVEATHVMSYMTGDPVPAHRLVFAADPGEANAVVIALGIERRFDVVTGFRTIVQDTGAPLSAGEGCALVSATEVVCTASGPMRVALPRIALGDGDDALRVSGVGLGDPAQGSGIEAGAGADRVEVDGNLEVMGGDGDDVLRATGPYGRLSGGAGDDELVGGANDDWFSGGPGSDRIDGGAGRDTVSYEDSPVPVTVQLGTAGTGGPAGELDTLLGIEAAIGGPRGDTLVGSAGQNSLLGGGGADRIEGGDGEDHLDGGAGTDVLLGGDGNDTLSDSDRGDVLDGGAGDDTLGFAGVLLGGEGDDELNAAAGTRRVEGGPGDDLLLVEDTPRRRFRGSCGSGRDSISRLHPRRLPPLDCETVLVMRADDADDRPRHRIAARLRVRGGRLLLPAPRPCDLGECPVRVEARVGSVVIARTRQPERGRVVVPVRLDRRERRLLARATRVQLRFATPGWPVAVVTVRAP